MRRFRRTTVALRAAHPICQETRNVPEVRIGAVSLPLLVRIGSSARHHLAGTFFVRCQTVRNTKCDGWSAGVRLNLSDRSRGEWRSPRRPRAGTLWWSSPTGAFCGPSSEALTALDAQPRASERRGFNGDIPRFPRRGKRGRTWKDASGCAAHHAGNRKASTEHRRSGRRTSKCGPFGSERRRCPVRP